MEDRGFQICPVCSRKTIMGIHPVCLPRWFKNSGTDPIRGMCAGCPYRKHTQWMGKLAVTLNRYLVLKGLIQNCHMSWKNGVAERCGGAIRCIEKGGDKHVYSPSEFLKLLPAVNQDETRKLYNERFKETANV